MTNRWGIYQGDALAVLRSMDTASVHCIVTSPPYWGLRHYGVAGEYGAEPTIAEYVETLTNVFREARRVLRSDGNLWLNLGDSYIGSGKGITNLNGSGKWKRNRGRHINSTMGTNGSVSTTELKRKDLAGIPWRVAFALQDDGWYLRRDIIWWKTNPTPEAVKDRPTASHEYIFLMSPSPFYYYDGDAIAEPTADAPTASRGQNGTGDWTPQRWPGIGPKHGDARGRVQEDYELMKTHPTRNKRDVWIVPTKGYRSKHIAVFPEDLIAPCILAGTSEYGVCRECESPWRRLTPQEERMLEPDYTGAGWLPTCDCAGGLVKPAVVLDPFCGSGTTGVVALRHGRDFFGIELNPEYISESANRIRTSLEPGPQLKLELGRV